MLLLKLCQKSFCALSAGQLRGGAMRDEAKNAEVLAAIKQAKDMLGQGPMLAGVEAKSINTGALSHVTTCHPQGVAHFSRRSSFSEVLRAQACIS